jgi:hypothetical protein
MGNEQKIHIEGPYTFKDIDEAEAKLKQGEVNVGELVKKFL